MPSATPPRVPLRGNCCSSRLPLPRGGQSCRRSNVLALADIFDAGIPARRHRPKDGTCCRPLRCYKPYEIAEFVGIQIRNGPKLKRVLLPGEDVIPLNRSLPNRGNTVVDRGPDVEIDRMQRPMIHQDSDCAVLQVIKPTTGERITLCREVPHGRRKIKLSIEPGLHRVLVGRDNIH